MHNQSTPPDILIVDDMPVNLRLLLKILREQGYKVRLASRGESALMAAQAQPPDLILLDIMMPGMDGYEVCRRLKADELTRDVPVIFISAINETLDKVTAFGLGGVDYIIKPFEIDEVVARVKTHLTIRSLQQQLEAQNLELQLRNTELEEALSTINTLSGLVPICAWCSKKIQDETGDWVRLEAYIQDNTDASFTHGMCPDCRAKMQSEIDARKE